MQKYADIPMSVADACLVRMSEMLAGPLRFTVSWLARGKNVVDVTSRPEKSWTWKTSYVIGLTRAEQLKPAIGISDPVTPAMIDAMATQAVVRDSVRIRNQTWDEDGFRRESRI